MQTPKPSPFSTLNNYKILYCTKKLVNLPEPTPREIVLLNILRSCGVAAGFQLEGLWQGKGRKKLKKLASLGVIAHYKLKGLRSLNVYSLDLNLDLNIALRRMAFAQLYMRIREIMPCEAAVCPMPLTGFLYFNSMSFPVLVLRKGDGTILLPKLLKDFKRLIVIAEEYKPYDLGVDYRLTTDGDLLEKPLHRAFYLPDGTRREILQFAV
ncbi:MAG: hypothetical protein K6T65_09125 [Peptococcaceae bacterium]|nr:hypothetical protein [Peptococcaceae bacterium]